jgi:uncharacterized protein YbaR (Trm112 family)
MEESLAALLCDPDTLEPLVWTATGLRNERSGRIYPLREGIVLFQEQVCI